MPNWRAAPLSDGELTRFMIPVAVPLPVAASCVMDQVYADWMLLTVVVCLDAAMENGQQNIRMATRLTNRGKTPAKRNFMERAFCGDFPSARMRLARSLSCS